ncbi:MAG: SUF system Fe-S cluster assembly regulator [Gammaproteobacteria bacterium]|nr:SUF system Fe-S cluster assembly regulator [Gammaproteobacteria bacterium]
MLRISKLTDYGTVLLAYLATNQLTVSSATEVAEATGITIPTVSKLLKLLARSGLINSSRGINGGYRLSKDPSAISAAHIIYALEGPITITECSGDRYKCEYESECSVSGSWQRINILIKEVLDGVSLKDLIETKSSNPHFYFKGSEITVENNLK